MLKFLVKVNLEKLNISMRLFCFSKIIVYFGCVFGLCGCSMSRHNMDLNLDDLGAIGVEEQIMVTDYAGAQVPISDIEGASGDVDKVPDGRLLPRISPGMLLNISVEVAGINEIYKESCNVSQDGDIYLPLLKSVDVAGLTVVEAEKKLTELCSQYFREPQVDISFSISGQDGFVSPWGYVTVMGNVVDPKRIALPQGRKLKLSEAVALAGGLAPSAKDRAVVLIRRTADGKVVKKKVNLRSIVAGGKIDRDVELFPSDYIFVPETIF